MHIFALAVLFAAPAPAPTPVPDARPISARAGDPAGVTSVTLDNGLTVLLSENHERPEIFGAVVVRTGGKNDPSDNTGMAHYLEHMLFKGTVDLGTTDWEAERPLQTKLEQLYEQLRGADEQQRKQIQREISKTVKQTYRYVVPNEVDQLLEQIGGTEVNAFTTYDETVYHNTFPASQLGAWLEIYAHRFEDPVFRLFPTELEAVYEEKNIAIDTTGYELFRSFMRAAFPGHPYGNNDILGEVEHLKRPSLVAMKQYYERWYVPANMALVLSGDFDTEEVLPMIRERFGKWEKRELAKPPAHPLRAFEKRERASMRKSPIRVGAVAFRTVPESDPDYAALLLARRLLSNEQRSGLVDRLSDDGKLLIAFYVPADFADHNLDVVAYAPRLLTQTFHGAEKIVLAQFEKIARGEFDERELEALREGLLAEDALEWEDNRERALAIGHAFVARRGWQGHLDYREKLRTVDKAEVMRVAAKLFGERRLVMRSRVGFPRKQRLDKPTTPPVKAKPGAHSEFYRAMQRRPAPPPRVPIVDVATAVRETTVAPGTKLAANTNPFNDIYTLQLRFAVGTDAMRELDVLDDYLGRIGSHTTDRTKFRTELSRISTTLEATAEPTSFTVELQGPQRHLDRALALVAELVREPDFERKPLRQVRREVWGYRRIGRKDAGDVAKALRERVVFGDNSSYLREVGPKGARAIGVGKLARAWQDVLRHRLELRYVGDAEPEAIAAAVKRALPLPAAHAPAEPWRVYPRQLPEQATVYFVPRRDAVQTRIWIAVEGDAITAKEHAAADAFSEYFGGSMAGLVFQEIREFRALAYSARASWERDESPDQRGYLLGYVGCQADKTFDALDVMTQLITKMPAREERLELVRPALVRSQETASPPFRELQATIESWQHMGYATDPRRELLGEYEDLALADIEQFYRAHVAGRPLAIMVVGDPRKVKPSRLKKYGKLVRVREGSLYSP
ncbi:MAG TPA: insulinase family protein [Nannocystaceae bacterium]|nr:insulinase family protein [Nannocystaceae bacterium]